LPSIPHTRWRRHQPTTPRGFYDGFWLYGTRRTSGGTPRTRSPLTKRLTNHLTKFSYFDIIVITFPLHFPTPTYLIPNILESDFESARLRSRVGRSIFQLQLRRNRVCTILSSHGRVTINYLVDDHVKDVWWVLDRYWMVAPFYESGAAFGLHTWKRSRRKRWTNRS